MSKRNVSSDHDSEIPRKKIRSNGDPSEQSIISLNNNEQSDLIDLPDLNEINRDDIESTIYETIQRNNISNAKAKYLIRKMLKHPHVIEWFRNVFNKEEPQLKVLHEPRITRSAKRKAEGGEDTAFSSLDANVIGKLLLSAPTINSYEFDNDDNNDNDYLPESENSNDSDQSSLASDNKADQVMLSPYCTRSKAVLDDFDIDVLNDSFLELESEEVFDDRPVVHESLTLEEMHNLMEMDAEDQRYEEFKKSLYTDDMKNDEGEDDPEFDVLAQIDDLDEDIFDDFRDDRSVKIPKSELWALLKDNNLVKGSGSSSTNKKTITMLCEEEENTFNEPCSNIKEILQRLTFTSEQKDRLTRQIIMFYQQLATIFIMVYDQPHLKPILDAQMSYYFRMTSNIPENSKVSLFNPVNRCVVEKILFNYKGISYIPMGRFNNSMLYRKIDFPKCIMATMFCSAAFPYVQLLPSSFKLYNNIQIDLFRQIPFLPSEDKLLTIGIIQFSHQCHKMLKLIKKYLFPIRSADQLRNRKTNIIRRQKELDHKGNESLADVLQFSGSTQISKKKLRRVQSDFAKLPVHTTPIWQRKDEWKSLLFIYKSFLIKTVPNIMYNIHLCSKEEWTRANRISSNRKFSSAREFQYCNWSSLPWELEKIDYIKNENKKSTVKTVLRKVINKKSFPQYEVPKNSQLREFLKKWNCNCDSKDVSKHPIVERRQNRNLIYLKKTVKKAKLFILKWTLKKETKKLQTEQSYAHYFRTDDTSNLFPRIAFKSRLEELISAKDLKNSRLQRFQNKCRLNETDIIDFTSASFSDRDENDLLFCRNLLNNLRNNLNADEYEQCLDKINEFQLLEEDTNFDDSVIELMKYLINIVKNKPGNVNIYEDLLWLLTLKQATKLGCEIEWCTVRNVNQLYSMIKSLNMNHKRRFWVRLSTLLHKCNEGVYPLSKVIQHLYTGFKANGYLQSLIAPLLNCWETPFPNYPQAFSNCDALSSNPMLSDFCKNSEKDEWEYCTELSEQPKTTCSCSCHDNNSNNTPNVKESSTIRHCSNCNLKAYNGCIYIDDGKIHRRQITLKLPLNFKPSLIKKDNAAEESAKSTNVKVDLNTSMSVLEFLKTKNAQVKQLHNRCITIKKLQDTSSTSNDENHIQLPSLLLPSSNATPYMRVLEDEEAAMDGYIFRQLKCTKAMSENEHDSILPNPKLESTIPIETTFPAQTWSEDDNLLLLTLCQKHGPTAETFAYLQEAHFCDRSVEQIEDQFNYLFQKVLEIHQQS